MRKYLMILMTTVAITLPAATFAAAPLCKITSISGTFQNGTAADLFIQHGATANPTLSAGSLTINFQPSAYLWQVIINGCSGQSMQEMQMSTSSASAKTGPFSATISAPANMSIFSIPEKAGVTATRVPIDRLVISFKQATCISHIDFISEPVKRTSCRVVLPKG